MEAVLYEPLKDGGVRCRLCSHYCAIKDGRRGLCNVRENHGGRLETLVYDKIIACHVDPIEKKPLFHFYPGSLAYSLGTVGCNFRCRFCQNADIAQMATDHDGRIIGKGMRPEAIVADAISAGCKSIAYTYTEPTVFFELAYAIAAAAHERGIQNIFVTNGYMSSEALDMIHPVLDAANVDLKAFSDEFYKRQCSARLAPVLETLKKMKALGVFVEVTTLIIPGLNDDPQELKDLANFIATDLGDDTPWHVSRFHPTYRLTDQPPTPVSTLLRARDIGMAAGLKYVYTGNVPGQAGENTVCYGCGETVIARRGFFVDENKILNNQCPACGALIHGVGLSG
ncbi:MAG: AmmeMemoRadiSam system radical SAM enzyme [Desulfobacteraceae bacterium]|nr:MAG: AmmeMemoRadiSam system radical SAM enzyme [Desulfobacteraceae bacterium]